MRSDFMDKVCEECIREEQDCTKNVTVEPDPQCDRCNFLAIIKIELYNKEMAERIIHRIEYVLNVILAPDICLRMKDGLSVEAELSDNDLREAHIFRFAIAISNALNLSKSDEEFLVLKIYKGETCKDNDEPLYEDSATSVSPLKIGRLAGFLQEKMGKGDVVGCVKIDGACKEVSDEDILKRCKMQKELDKFGA